MEREWIQPIHPAGSNPDASNHPEFDRLALVLPELDLARALQRIDGDRRFFYKLLIKVYEYHSNDLTIIHQALEQGQMKVAYCTVHNLRGVLETIGLELASSQLYPLEVLLQKGDTREIAKVLEILEQVLTPILQGLATLLPDDPQPAPEHPGECSAP